MFISSLGRTLPKLAVEILSDGYTRRVYLTEGIILEVIPNACRHMTNSNVKRTEYYSDGSKIEYLFNILAEHRTYAVKITTTADGYWFQEILEIETGDKKFIYKNGVTHSIKRWGGGTLEWSDNSGLELSSEASNCISEFFYEQVNGRYKLSYFPIFSGLDYCTTTNRIIKLQKTYSENSDWSQYMRWSTSENNFLCPSQPTKSHPGSRIGSKEATPESSPALSSSKASRSNGIKKQCL